MSEPGRDLPAAMPAALEEPETESREAEPLSIYVHLPFCRERCPYCDFFVLVEHGAQPRRRRFVDLVRRELELALEAKPRLSGRRIATIYLGGGTPSLFAPEELQPLFDDLRAYFEIYPDAEVTMEANPTSFLAGNLGGYADLGINRLSLGVQTFDEAGLRALGRGHTPEQARAALRAAAAEPRLRSFSADLIFGYAGHTEERLEQDFRELVEEFGVPHISAYSLTLHEGTPMQRRAAEGRLVLPEDEAIVGMFRRLRTRGPEAGLPPYEISNFARPGHESRHNTAYWTLRPVLPLGPSACGYLGGRRPENPRSWEEWTANIEAGRLPWRWPAPAQGRSLAGEVTMCALRRTEGATWDWLEQLAGRDVRALYAGELDAAEARGWLRRDTERLALSEEGVLWSDEFFTSLF